RTGIAFVVVPMEGPRATSTLLPVCFSYSGTSAVKAAVSPPEIITRTSAACAAGASRSKAARDMNDARSLLDRGLMVVPPGDPVLSWTIVQGKWLNQLRPSLRLPCRPARTQGTAHKRPRRAA